MLIENPLVSIVVPVYNVEKYLKRCLDSIIAQSYRNLQIILVDDGSTDMSGLICDEYAEIDSRVYVLHKQNSGVADTRNWGLDAAKGDFISFVDPDDWIEKKMIESLVQGLQMGTDISMCDFFREYKGKVSNESFCTNVDIEQDTIFLTRKDGLRLLLADKIPNFTWNKMYRKELFENGEKIRFPVGVNYEDVATNYLLFNRCDRIVLLKKQLYHYEYRSTGITGGRNTKDFIDHCEIRIARYEWSQIMCPDLCDIQCIGIADVLIRIVAATIRDTFLRKLDKCVRIENQQKRQQLNEKLKKMDSFMYSGLDNSWKMIYRLCMMDTWLTDYIAIGFELLRRKMEKKRC